MVQSTFQFRSLSWSSLLFRRLASRHVATAARLPCARRWRSAQEDLRREMLVPMSRRRTPKRTPFFLSVGAPTQSTNPPKPRRSTPPPPTSNVVRLIQRYWITTNVIHHPGTPKSLFDTPACAPGHRAGPGPAPGPAHPLAAARFVRSLVRRLRSPSIKKNFLIWALRFCGGGGANLRAAAAFYDARSAVVDNKARRGARGPNRRKNNGVDNRL